MGVPFFGKNCRSKKSTTARKHVAKLNTYRPMLESLEDRTLPSITLPGVPIWHEQGPAPITGDSNVVGIELSPAAGAIQAIAVHPIMPDVIYIGSVNGGIWRTTNALNPDGPTWTPVTDDFPSLSINSIALSPIDPTPFDAADDTIYAGLGRSSSSTGEVGDRSGGGAASGILKSTNGGQSWIALGQAFLGGLHIQSIVPTNLLDPLTQKQIVLVAAADLDRNGSIDRGGVYRSVDGGETWIKIPMLGSDGVAAGSATDLMADPGDNNRFYAGIAGRFSDPNKGVYRSLDGGATWTHLVQNIDGFDVDASTRIRLAVHNNALLSTTAVYAAFIAPHQLGGHVLSNVYRSANHAGSWQKMDLPGSTEQTISGNPAPTKFVGIHPARQAGTHFSIAADPINPTVVYVGGDRQPGEKEDVKGNAAGLMNPMGQPIKTARLFRGDASQASGQQWQPIVGTGASGTAPHADSRAMVVTSSGDILEADDGGIYRLQFGANPIPIFSRSWESLNNNLSITEFYSVAFDPIGNRIFGGTQDNGTPIQDLALPPAIPGWHSLAGGDGGIVQVNPFFKFLRSGSISNASSGTPIEITSPDHGLFNGDIVQVSGVEGNTAANGVWEVIGVTADTFRLNRSTGNGAYQPGTGKWELPNQVQLFFSQQFLGDFRRQVFFETASVAKAFDDPTPQISLSVNIPGDPVIHRLTETNQKGEFTFDRTLQFVQPYVLNAVDPHRMLIGTNSLYESFSLGSILTPVESRKTFGKVTAMVYGGMRNGVAEPGVAYVATGGKDNHPNPLTWPVKLWLRERDGALFRELTSYVFGEIKDIVLDPDDWHTVYVVNERNHVFKTTDAGANWLDITADLSRRVTGLRTIELAKIGGQSIVLVGGTDGVYRSIDPDANAIWTEFGQSLPNAPVTDIRYYNFTVPNAFDPAEPRVIDRLLIGTLGRGAWTIDNASGFLTVSPVAQIDGTNGADLIRLQRNAVNPAFLDVSITDKATSTLLETRKLQLSTLQRIDINGLNGNDELVIDHTNGLIVVPDGINYDAGDGDDTLSLQGTFRFTLLKTGPDGNGDGTVKLISTVPLGGVEFIDFQSVRTVTEQMIAPPPSPADVLSTLQSGLQQVAAWSTEFNSPALLGQPLPVLGHSLGRALNGTERENVQPIGGPAGGAELNRSAQTDESNSVLWQLIETGVGAFSLSDIGTTITTLEDFRARLDGLDTFPGNVSLALTTEAVTFDVQIVKTLSGDADIALSALGGAVALVGNAEISADLHFHLVFGVDAQGFFIDVNGNPDPMLVVDAIRIEQDAPVEGRGRFGFTDVDLLDAELEYDIDVELGITLREPGPDPFSGVTDGRLRPYELGPLTEALVTGSLTGSTGFDDVNFTATLLPVSLNPLDPDTLLGLGPSDVTMTWVDVTNLSLGPTFSPDDARLLPFIDIVANQLTFGGVETASALRRLSQTDGNVLSEDLALTGTSVGEILDSPVEQVHPVALEDSTVVNVSNLFEDVDFKKFQVIVGDVNLPEQGVAIGDAIAYTDSNGNGASGTVDSVGISEFVVRFDKSLPQAAAHASTPSFTIVRSGDVRHQLAAFLNPLVDPAVVGLVSPTLQEFVERLAAVSGVPVEDIEVTGDLTGSNPFIQIGVTLKPAALIFDQTLDLDANIQGMNLSAGSGFDFKFEPTYRLNLGLNMAAGVGASDRFFIVADATPVVDFKVSADVDVPTSGYTGEIGYLNVGLTPDATNNGAQIDGNFTVSLADPGTLRQDGRISLNELALPNPSTTQPAFKVIRATTLVEVPISEERITRIDELAPQGGASRFTVTLEVSNDLPFPAVATGDSVQYRDTTGTLHTASIEAVTATTFTIRDTVQPTWAFTISRAGTGTDLNVIDGNIIKIEDAQPDGNLNKFLVTLKSTGLLPSVAKGDVVHYLDDSGHQHTATVDKVTDTQFTVSYSITPLFDANINADFNIDRLKVASNVSNSSSTLGDLIISLNGSGVGTPGHVTSLAQLQALSSQIQVQGNKQAFLDYNNISPDMIFAALKVLATRLADLAGLNSVDLPLLNLDINNLLDFKASFADKIQLLTAGQIPTAEALVAFLRNQFPNLTLKINGGDFQFDLAFNTSLETDIPLTVDFGAGSLTGDGKVKVTAAGNLNLGVGFSTAANLDVQDRFFLAAGGSNGFSATLNAKAGYNVPNGGSPFGFSVDVGPISAGVKQARVLLNNAQFAATIQDGGNGDQRLTLREITDQIGGSPQNVLTGGFTGGSLQAVLPIDGPDAQDDVDPTLTNLGSDAWVDVAGLLSNLDEPIAFNSNTTFVTHHTGFGGAAPVDQPLDNTELNFSGTPFEGKFVVSAYNIDGLIGGLFDFNPNELNLEEGLDEFLDNLQTHLLDGPILELPLLGDQIKGILNFVDDLQLAFDNLPADATPADLEQSLDFHLGDILKEIVVTPGTNDVLFQLHLMGHAELGVNMAGSLGIPGLELKVDSGTFTLFTGYDFQFNFGVSKNDGFYVDTDSSKLDLTFSAEIRDFLATGHLFFLQVDVNKDLPTGQPIKPIVIGGGKLAVDLKNPFSSNAHLTHAQLTSGGFDPLDLFGAELTLSTDIPLHLKVSFDGAKGIPSLETDFAFHWDFLKADIRGSTLDFGGLPAIAFNNVTLDLGSFVNDFIQPLMDVVNGILDPIRPIIDTLNTRLPGFSDLPDSVIDLLDLDAYDHNNEVSLLDFAQKYLGDSSWGVALKVFQYIDKTSRTFKTGQSGGLPLGNFVISTGAPDGFDVRGLPSLSSFAIDPVKAAFQTAEELVNDHLGDGGVQGFVKGFLKDSITNVSQELGGKRLIELPIIEKPTTAFGLLLGRDVDLVFFNPPKFDIPLQVDEFFRLLGPLGVRLVGGLKGTIEFHFGFDTFGLREALQSGNPAHIFDGFYTTNRANADGTGPIVPQVLLDARVTVGGGVDIFVASATVNGGIYTRGTGPNPFQLTATLCDHVNIDNNPARIRFRELNGFEMQGDLRAGIFAEVTLGKWPLKVTKVFPFAEKVLLNLDHPCEEPEPILANFAKPDGSDLPNLTENGVDVYNNNANGPVATLRLNMGPRAKERKHKHKEDIAEVFIINHVDGVAGDETIDVIAFGTKQRYFHVKDVFADGGDHDDTVTLQRTSADGAKKGVQSFALLLGGAGNDNLNAGAGVVILFGGPGNDALYGGPHGDLIYGEQGDDVIIAGAGNDLLVGGSKDRTGGAKDDGADFIMGGDGDDRIAGDNANFDDPNSFNVFDDTAAGKFGNDRILAGAGKDTVFGTSGHDEIYGEDGDDDIRAGRGNDSVSGGGGNDVIVGARDDDVLNGDEGNDFVEGGLGRDQVYGGLGNDRLIGDQASLTTTESSADRLDAGDGDDILIGDNGTISPQGNVSVNGSGGDDTMLGGGGADRMYGQGGNDFMEGGIGNDVMFGADGNDTILGQRDDDYAEGNAASDSVQGGPGADRLLGGSTTRDADDSGDNISGDEGNDWIIGDNGTIDTATGRVQTLDDGKGAKDTIFGGAGDDIVFGGTGGDDLTGDAINDIGNDIIIGDDGSATTTLIVAQTSPASGNDNIFGSGGNDTVLGGDGKDTITGDAGLDVVLGDNGKVTRDSNKVNLSIETADPQSGDADSLSGGAGADVVLGGTGGDTIDGGSDDAADILLGDNGKVIFDDAGDAANRFTIFTTDPTLGGADTITGGPGPDTVVGGVFDDSLVGGTGTDVLVGDGVRIKRNADGVVLRITTIDPEAGGNDVIAGNDDADTALGGTGDDTISGGDDVAADILLGDNGVVVGDDGSADANDIFTDHPTFGGADTISGGRGGDTILGGSGNADLADPITFLGGGDLLFGNEDSDILLGDNGRITRNSGNLVQKIETTFPGQGGNDSVLGEGGDDTILGGFGGDTLIAHDGNDVVLGDNGFLDYVSNGNTSTLILISTAYPTLGTSDNILGQDGNDTLLGGTASETIHGGNGHDLIFGDHGKVDLTLPPERNFFSIDTGLGDGGAADVLFGNAGNDTQLGGQGDDQVFGEENDDDLMGGHNVAGGADGNDTMDGGTGHDALAGDNASIIRRSDTLSPLIRVLVGTELYDASGQPAVTGAFQVNPTEQIGRDVVIYDGESSAPAYTHGNDYMAGGPQNDLNFGQAGNDVIQGDGSVTLTVSAMQPSQRDWGGAGTDGDDYVEGNNGDDVIFGNLGQDDLIGGSSDLFGQDSADKRGDGSDTIFGGAGDDIGRNSLGDLSANGHAADADVILGDNGAIYRLVGTNGAASGAFLELNYDYYSPLKIIPRVVDLLDYTRGGSPADTVGNDLLFGEAGDDIVHGMGGKDILFGNGQDDDLYGEAGADRIYGGAGEDGVLGDDGMIHTSRNGLTEPLHGVATVNAQVEISLPGPFAGAWIFITGRLNKSAQMLAWTQGGHDVIYGGLGDDFLHGGAGNDGISGAEAQAAFHSFAPQPDGDPLGYDPVTRKLAAYDANNPLKKIAGFFLNFDAVDGSGAKIEDGKDRLFGDLGHDWLVGGTQNDRLFGGKGDDLHNLDDNHDTAGGLNNQPDAPLFADRDFAYGGDGLDVLIANTGGDRMYDWGGEFNSYLVPFSPFGNPTVVRSPAPHIRAFVLALGRESGADQGLTEPNGELGLFTQSDPEWKQNHGGPRDPQAGNNPGTHRDTKGSPEDDRDTALPLTGPGSGGGGSSSLADNGTDVTVDSVYVDQDPTDPTGYALYVGGTNANDTIEVRRGANDALIQVVVNGVIAGEFNRTTLNLRRVIVHGNSGNDTITINDNLSAIAAVIFGGDGNDTIQGGRGNNYVDGGTGNDSLRGHSGADVLIGGDGADTIHGGHGDDLLVGGTYNYSEDFDAIDFIMATWGSTLSYSQRQTTLRAGNADGLFGFTVANLLDDGDADDLTGHQGQDWFWVYAGDDHDKKGNENTN